MANKTDTAFYYCHSVTLFGLMLILTLSNNVESQDDFYFRKWPQSPTGVLRMGQSLRLDCRVSAEDRISISWTLDGETVLNTSRRYQDPLTGDLIIRRADRRLDSGSFSCSATNISSGFSIVSQPAIVTVLWIGQTTHIFGQLSTIGRAVVEEEPAARVRRDDDVALTCVAEGSGELQFDWFHNGRKLPKSRAGRVLVLNAVGSAESGTYVCIARNAAGQSRFNAPYVLSVASSSRVLNKFVRETIAAVDTSIRLPCSFNPPATVEWFFRGTALSSNKSSQYSIEADGELVIPKVSQLQHEGHYTCRKNVPGEAQEDYVSYLRIAYLDDFAKNPIDPPPLAANGQHYFAEYSTAELSCIAPEAQPSPVVWWEGPGGRTLTTPTNASEAILVLNRLLPEEAGHYRCWAENTVRKVFVPVHLVITVPPVIYQHPIGASVNEGDDVSMTCSFTGVASPATTINWLKDGQPLPDSFSPPAQGWRNSSLLFAPTVKAHAGNYVCLVETIGHPSVTSQPAFLYVREQLKFSLQPISRKLELGSSSKVHCKAQGNPPPLVQWVKEGRQFFHWPPHVEDLNGTLFFRGVRPGDEGNYTCIATSSQGLINSTIRIDVIKMPYFVTLPENITVAREGGVAELICRAIGQPLPTIKWDKDSVMLDTFSPERYTAYLNGTLIIHNVQADDEGQYGCTAGNSGGFKRAEFRLIVQSWDYQSDHEGESITKTIIITLGAALAYILLSVGLLIWCRLKRRQRKLRTTNSGDTQPNPQTALLAKDAPVEAGLHPVADRLIVSSTAITRGSLMGKGRFGEVLEGFVIGLASSEGSTRVLLRTLTNRDEDLILEFRRQSEMFHRVLHVNLVAVLGYCRDSADAHLILLTEYEGMINLKSYLLLASGQQSPVWSPALVSSATLQIARGMNALAQSRFVHRDLGTRNILVGFQGKDNQMIIKIGSYGMDLTNPFSNDYYTYKHKSIPIRWLPHEAVLEDEYSNKSDVWSFACTIWEINHGAITPFATQTNEAVLADLTSRSIHWDSSFCKSNAFASLLSRCWSHDPIQRPTFDELLSAFELTTSSSGSNGESSSKAR